MQLEEHGLPTANNRGAQRDALAAIQRQRRYLASILKDAQRYHL